MVERLVHSIVRLTLKHRWFSLAWLTAFTIFFAYQALAVRMYSKFSDLLPQAHPYVVAYNHFRQIFGTANVMTLELQVKHGDIFTVKTLKKIRFIHQQLDLMDGVDHDLINSITGTNARKVTATNGGLIISRPLLPDKIPTRSADLERLKYDVLHSLAYGVLVSPDASSALVTAGFNEGQVNYGEMHRRLAGIKQAVEDDNTVLYATGEPVLKAWCWYYKGELAEIFTVTGLFIVLSLVLYFRRAYGVLLPMVGAAAQIIWGLGFLGLLGYNLDVLVLVIPLLVTARAASHGVQLLERYFEELERTGDRHQAVHDSMSELFLPGAIGILADAAGILVLGVATIPLVRKVAFFASFWGFSNIFTILILLPLLLDVLPTPKVTRHYVPHWLASGLHWVGESCTSWRGRWVVFGIAGVVVALGIQQALKLPIGYTEPGSPLLWPDSDFNVSSRHVNRSYGGYNDLVIYLEGDRDNAMKDPALLALLDNFSRYMLVQPKASGSRYITTLVRRLQSLFHYNDPKWEIYPNDVKGIGQMVFMYESSAPSPTIIFQYMDYTARNGQLVIYYKDIEGSTVLEAITRARKFIAAHPTPHVNFILAGGSIGLTAALNDEIAYSDRVSTLLILAVVFTLVAFSYASFTAGAMVLMTLIAAGVVSFLYIGLKGVGININTLPVTAVGMGIGVDYILYVVDRIKREYGRLGDYDGAIKRAINTSGMAVTFTATTLVGGVLPWYWMSSLRFSAEMALLLALLMLTHWLAAITLVPSIFSIVRPAFVARDVEPPQAPPASEANAAARVAGGRR
ncbi:MAG TPA: MMPL family transporter [Candidatus Binataceae bacterium]|jgi:predicted RND superfamily exporter protein|nr:MMPL family transporter [Candidatus Binataceae bacterium]